MKRALLVLLLGTAAAPAFALDLSFRAEAEARYFYQAEGETFHPSLAGTLELFHGWHDDKERVVLEAFARKDLEDEARTHGDLRELYYEVIGNDLEFRVGNRRVFWGVAESRHLVDIINQSDFVEDIDNEMKLGQPMMNFAFIGDYGTVDVFLMPYQRARTFPGPNGHPRLPFPVAANEALYESPRAQYHLDFAIRYRNYFGPLDVGLAWFDGTARDPRLLPCLARGSGFNGTENGPNCDIFSGIDIPQSPFPEPVTTLLMAFCEPPVPEALQAACLLPNEEEVAAGIEQQVRENLVLVPFYSRLRQFSIDAQYVYESLALKLEAVARERDGDHSLASVTGFEYTFGDVARLGWDVGVLGEFLFDERDDLLSSRVDHDWFVGTRLALNDIAGTQLLAGVLFDTSGKDQLYQIEGSRRLGEDWKLSMKFRAFEQIPDESPANFLENEDMLSLTLERFF